jgi:hypothetical protein
MKIVLTTALISTIAIAGCATPSITLKNEQTGQVARCGGDSSGFMAGGAIGYSIQKENDAKCVADYEALGFKKVQ